MEIRSYILYGRTVLEKLRVSVQELLREWAGEWKVAEADVSLSAIEPLTGLGEDEGSDRVLVFAENDAKWALAVENRELFEEMGSLLLLDNRVRPRQGSIEDSIIADLVTEALKDMLSRLVGKNVPGRFSKSALDRYMESDVPGCGILRLHFRMGGSGMRAYISSEVVRELSGSERSAVDGDGELVSALEALAMQQVPLRAVLGNAELTLDALSSLQVGDVIRLDESLHEPLVVDIAKSGNACRAFLGQKDGKLAIQIDSPVRI